MVKCMDPNIRTRNFEARNERIEAGTQRKTEAKGNPSALTESKESAINGKRKDSAQEETLVVSATVRINVEWRCSHPLLHQNRRRKAMGKIVQKEKLSEATKVRSRKRTR